jgi:hypothetical protein
MTDRGFFEESAPDSPPVRISLPELGNSEVKDGRTCPKCGEFRKTDDFARDRSKASGRTSICKACDRAKAKAYYAANRERVIARVSAGNRQRSQ